MKKLNAVAIACLAIVSGACFAAAAITAPVKVNASEALLTMEVELTDDIAVHYYLTDTEIDENSVVATVDFNGESDIPLSAEKIVSDNNEDCYKIDFNGVTAKLMGKDVTINVDYTSNGTQKNFNETKSVKTYCVELLDTKDTLSIDCAKKQVLPELVSNMLSYGAAAQVYCGETESANLVTDGLTLSGKEYSSSAATTINKTDGQAIFCGANVEFSSEIGIVFYFRLENDVSAEGLTATAVIDGAEKTGIPCVLDGDKYKFVCDGISATQMDTPITVSVSNKDGALSGSATYSIGSYVARTVGTATDNMKNLAKATYSYGSSAVAYKNAEGHVYGEAVITYPSSGVKGVKTYTCKYCDDVKTEEIADIYQSGAEFRAEAEDYLTAFTAFGNGVGSPAISADGNYLENLWTANGKSASFTITSYADCAAIMNIGVAGSNGTAYTLDSSLSVTVNGTAYPFGVKLIGAGWTTTISATVFGVRLNEGENTITFTNISTSPNIDYIEFIQSDADITDTSLYCHAQAVTELHDFIDKGAFDENGRIAGMYKVKGATASFDLYSTIDGTAEMTFAGAWGNADIALDSAFEFAVNGTIYPFNKDFVNGGWSTDQTATTDGVDIKKGKNVVSVKFIGDNCPNLTYLEFKVTPRDLSTIKLEAEDILSVFLSSGAKMENGRIASMWKMPSGTSATFEINRDSATEMTMKIACTWGNDEVSLDGVLEFYVNDVKLTTGVTVKKSSWDTNQLVVVPNIQFKEGVNTIKVVYKANCPNLDYFEFIPA